MKLSKLLIFSLLVTPSVVADEVEHSNIPLPSLVKDYADYCSEIRPDDEVEIDVYILNCVNTQLIDSGFDTFSNYSELVEYMNKEDE